MNIYKNECKKNIKISPGMIENVFLTSLSDSHLFQQQKALCMGEKTTLPTKRGKWHSIKKTTMTENNGWRKWFGRLNPSLGAEISKKMSSDSLIARHSINQVGPWGLSRHAPRVGSNPTGYSPGRGGWFLKMGSKDMSLQIESPYSQKRRIHGENTATQNGPKKTHSIDCQ